MRSLSNLGCLLTFVVALSACHRHLEPSKDFAEASAQFNQLYAQNLDEAFLDPQMTEIEAQLARVPSNSLDAAFARALAQRIREGKARMQALEDERQKAHLAAMAPTPNFAFKATPAPPPDAPSAKPVDAGLAAEPTAGLSMRDFVARFGDCFEQGGPIQVPGSGMRDTWVVKDQPECRERHATFVQNLVVSDGVTVMGIYPKSSVVHTPVVDGGAP